MLREERLKELLLTPRCGDDAGNMLDSTAGLIEMVQEIKPSVVLEIGSDRGVSTEIFLLHCEHVVAIDPWINLPYRYDEFMARCSRYKNLTIIRDSSPDVLRFLAPGSFDMVYIDAVHEYNALVNDVVASFPLVKNGGWIAGHDYYFPDNKDNVIRAVNDIFGSPKKIYSDSSWLSQLRQK